MSDNIHAYVSGCNIVNRGSGFACVLISQNNRWERSLIVGNHSVNTVELLGLKFALLSIAQPFKKNPLIIHIRNKWISIAIDKNNWAKVPSTNSDLIVDIRKMLGDFKVDDSDDVILSYCKEMAEDTVMNNDPKIIKN